VTAFFFFLCSLHSFCKSFFPWSFSCLFQNFSGFSEPPLGFLNLWAFGIYQSPPQESLPLLSFCTQTTFYPLFLKYCLDLSEGSILTFAVLFSRFFLCIRLFFSVFLLCLTRSLLFISPPLSDFRCAVFLILWHKKTFKWVTRNPIFPTFLLPPFIPFPWFFPSSIFRGPPSGRFSVFYFVHRLSFDMQLLLFFY